MSMSVMDGGSKVPMPVDESPQPFHEGAKCLSMAVVHMMLDTNLRVP